jgi:hypothetical protein
MPERIGRIPWALAFVLLFGATSSPAQQGKRLKIHHQDAIEVVFSRIATEPDTVFAYGSVVLETASGAMIYCDTAIYAMERSARLFGRVIIDDPAYRLAADDSVYYDAATQRARAYGDYVELFSESDSMLAIGTFAFFDRKRDYFYMTDRPTVYLNYQDSANMTEVIADLVEYDARTGVAEVQGNVSIQSHDVTALSGCAVMRPRLHLLDLYDRPVVRRHQSEITGQFISMLSEYGLVRQVDVVDSAYAEFIEPKDSTQTAFDKSILRGRRLILDFEYGQLRHATCRGQAYSWYLPATPEGGEKIENEVSGASIRFTIRTNQLQVVEVVGGSMGTYLSTRPVQEDTVLTFITDTVNYRARHITYDLPDSLITLVSSAQTTSGSMALDAYRIEFDTRDRIIEAFSGSIGRDSITYDNMFAQELQPNDIPVVLKDVQGDLFGDYLRYSVDPKKGRIVRSKAMYESGYFYGHNLYRQQEDIFYMEECRYTTCDAAEPHFHFRSKHIKLIEGNRLIAKPIYLYIGRLPILALPYYVFPLEKGRHSGLLPFTFGNFERGERYVQNVGYYWAASDCWDVLGAVDYYEQSAHLNLQSQFRYKRLYAYEGYVKANWGRSTTYSRATGSDAKTSRWTIEGKHDQQVTPSFKWTASGKALSDATYYEDFSNNLDDRLNRTIRSQVTFSKKFSKSYSVSGGLTHDNNLDTKARTDQLPYLTFSSVRVKPFGQGTLNDDGKLEQRWYNQLIVTHTPSLLNFSNRTTKKVPVNYFSHSTFTADTTFVIDTLTGDTTIADIDIDTLVSSGYADTLQVRSRKEYTRMDHSVSATMPLTVARYVKFTPNISYRESWYKIHQTDQSDAKGIDASTLYRNYTASAGASVSTTLYGTIYPNAFGLAGFRQVLTPTLGYSLTPTIRRHQDISAFAGGTGGLTRRSQNLNVNLVQVYQAKIKRSEQEKNLELLSVSSGFSYNFEAEGRRFSDLSSSYNTTLLRNPRINAGTTHSFYRRDDDGR